MNTPCLVIMNNFLPVSEKNFRDKNKSQLEKHWLKIYNINQFIAKIPIYGKNFKLEKIFFQKNLPKETHTHTNI